MASRLRMFAMAAITAGVCLTGVLLPKTLAYSSWFDSHGTCTDGYEHQQIKPYGEVFKCHSLDTEVPLLRGPDARAWVLLETERGLVALRIDYRNTKWGRQYTADAFEVSPEDTPGDLSAEQKRQHVADVKARGGVRKQEWILHYGDG